MKVTLYDKNGKKTEKKIDLDQSIFSSRVNKKLLSQAVYVYLANQRQANAHSKDRGEVSGGGRKPWKQKGTGRARHGSTRSPIWRGGGTTFGPTNERNYKLTMPRKMKRAAIRSALSSLALENKVIVMQKPELKSGELTKQVLKIVENLGTDRKVLFVQRDVDANLVNAVKNLKEITVRPVNEINAYSLLNTKWIVLTEEALEKANEFWKGSEKSVVAEKAVKEKKSEKKVTKKVSKKAVRKETNKTSVKKSVKKGKK